MSGPSTFRAVADTGLAGGLVNPHIPEMSSVVRDAANAD